MIDTLLDNPPADDWRTYVPVLRAKASEWKALELVTPGVRQRICPILEFIPDWNAPGANTTGRKRRAPQTHAEYVQRFLERADAATPSGTRSFVYFGLAGSEAKWSGLDLWAEFDSRVPAQKRVVPLVDLGSVGSSAVLARVARSRGEIGLRFDGSDVNATLGTRIDSALKAVGVVAKSAHLIVDLKDTPGTTSHAQLRAALGNVAAFESVVVLAGVFPQYLTQYQQGITLEPRTEWQAWWREHIATPGGDRLLAFGDYMTQCAHYYVPPKGASPTVSLRYTTDDAFLVLRGMKSNSATGFDHKQMHGHCRLLLGRAEYCGASFSAGDHRIYCWTNASNSPGSFEQWRTASFVHHITHVVVQLQDAVGSSATVRTWARAQVPAPCP